ncbi:hypothetical protein V8D89_008767 [Ganoderma adspersum]
MTTHTPPNPDLSPTQINAGSAATYSSTHGATEEFRSSFGLLLTKDRVQYDRKEVLHKLLSDNSTHFSGDASLVDEIWHVIDTERRTDLDNIRNTAQEADAKKKDNPQTNIIDTIDKALSTRMGGRERKYYRQFLCTGYSPLDSHDPTDPYAFKYKPDFSVVERPKPPKGGAIVERPASIGAKPGDLSVEWRYLVSYMEIKSSTLDAPSPSHVTGNPALTQATDYARGVLVYLPFQLYVYGIIFCGSEFQLTWTDRGGVVLSPKYSLLDGEGLRTFIRIVLRLTWELSPYELGQDPNTEYLKGHKSLGHKSYPDLRVRMGGPNDDHTWTTFGNPLWLSHTLFGRGTSVWRVLTDEGSPRILKVAWRTANRRGELEIYKRMKEIIEDAGQSISGMVNLESIVGGDVHFKGTALAIPMTVSILHPRNTAPQVLDMQLHRVVFDDVGKPLWKYQSPEQLVRAMSMALVAHRDLCSLGILHRDISAGNILIRLIPVMKGGKFEGREMDVEKTEGFLTDFEFASLPRSESEGPKTASGDDMTGTVAFMASSLLHDIKQGNPGEAASRTAEQDIESFAWVFVFVVYKHSLEDPKVFLSQNQKKSLREEFNRLFPGRSAQHVLTARNQMTAPAANQHIMEYIRNHVENPDYFGFLFGAVWTILVNRLPKPRSTKNELIVRALKKGTPLNQLQTPSSPAPPTHSDVLNIFDAYLELVEEAKGK